MNENLERNNKWLEENMGHLSAALKAERCQASAQVSLSCHLCQSKLLCIPLELDLAARCTKLILTLFFTQLI